MRTKFGILWTIFVFGALQLSHYSCADDLENQNKTTATTVIPSASPTTKAKEDTITDTEGNINQSTSASRTSSVTEVVQTDSATTTVNPAAPTTVPPKPTDKEPQNTTSVVTTALPASTGPPTSLTTSISPSVTSSVTTLETKTTQNTPSLTASQGTTQNTPSLTESQGTTQNTPSLTESQGTTQNTPSLTSSQATTQTDSVTETTNSPKQTSVASPTTKKIKDAHTPTTEISTASPTAGNTSPTQPQNITTSSTQQNIATSSTQPQNITTAPTQPPTTGTSSTQTGNEIQVAREDDRQDSSAILTTTLAGVTKSLAETGPFNRQIKWTDAKNQEDKNDVLLKVCWELLKNMNSETSCIIQGNETNKNYTFTSVHVAADLLRVQQIYSNIKKSNDNPEQLRMPEVLPVVLASCGALVLILVACVLCYMCHRRLYRKNQQQLTEEMQTMENGYHDNPTLEVMEFQPEMQEKKPPLNGEFNDSWIVPIDNLPKDDFSEEEDTHL